VGAGAKHQLVFVNRLLATLVHLRHRVNHDVLACWFQVDRSTITRAIGEIRPLLAERGCTVDSGAGLQNSIRPSASVTTMALTAFCLLLPEMNTSRSLLPAFGRRTRISVPSMIPVAPVASRCSTTSARPEQTAAVARAAFPKGSLAMRLRDEFGLVFQDADFAGAFGARGRPRISPAVLMLVTVLQFVERLTDRQAVEAVAGRIDWKYALGLPLDDPGFDNSVLSEFRGRLVEHDLSRLCFDRVLERCRELGLVRAGGKQRTQLAAAAGEPTTGRIM
jgi:transposase